MDDIKITDVDTLFQELDAGILAQRLGKALSHVGLGVVNTGKKGKVTLTFAFEQIGESNQVEIDHTLKVEEPTPKGKLIEENTTSTPMYVGSRGVLSIIPDTQQKLFERET